MNKPDNTFLRAKIIFFFKETFRAHSMAEYREIFSRGLNDDNGGITGAFPWLYVRAFFALFILFTVNTLVLRLTNNTLFIPSVTFLGGITFTIPFIILLYELYPKRDISLFVIFAVLVGGGTAASALTQAGYYFIPITNEWFSAVVAGVLEEICKIIPVILIINFSKRKNPCACYLLAAAVGAGFSVIEDMGYIFLYSDKYAFYYHSDIQATIALFVDRGFSSFCSHILWTGAVGWAYSISKRPFRSVYLAVLAVSIVLHACWDLPLTGFLQVFVIGLCVIIAAAINIAIIHKSRINTLAAEIDLTRVNAAIISEAKTLGERMRFTNAANLTFALTCGLLSVIILILCALPIGMEYQGVDFDDKEQFIAYLEREHNFKADWNRKIKDPFVHENNVEERYEYNDGELVLTHVIQCDTVEGYEGLYYYGYYLSDTTPNDISVELDEEDYVSRIACIQYVFGDAAEWVFEFNFDVLDYTYNKDGTVTAIIDAEEFSGYNILIGLTGTACAVTVGCAVILTAFSIKLRRVKDEQQ